MYGVIEIVVLGSWARLSASAPPAWASPVQHHSSSHHQRST